MKQMIQPLVITPIPFLNESLMGLILRTSETNGYSSPTLILRHAGLTENEIRSINPPLGKIAQLFAKKPEEFKKYGSGNDDLGVRKKRWLVANHVIPTLYVNVKSAKICTQCVAENGYVDEFWDLRFAHVCTSHKRELIDTCPVCSKPLKWQRKGLLTCSCGNNLTAVYGDVVQNQSILNMTELLRWKLNNHQYDTSALVTAGYPLRELEKISISTLLGIVERFQIGRKRKTVIAVPDYVKPKFRSLWIASNMLADWPRGFFNFLNNLPDEVRRVHSRNIQSHYLRIYKSFFKSGLPEDETLFIRQAFVCFANQDAGANVYIDARLAKYAEAERRYVGVLGLAEYLKVRLPTIRKYIKMGLIKPFEKEHFGKTRYIFDLSKIPFLPRDGNYLRQREAAKYIQLSEKNLRALKQSGAYRIKRLGWGTDGYSELDLMEFKSNLINKAQDKINAVSNHQIVLRALMRKKSLKATTIASIFKGVLNGEILPIGRIGDELPDLVFSREGLSAYSDEANIENLRLLVNKCK